MYDDLFLSVFIFTSSLMFFFPSTMHANITLETVTLGKPNNVASSFYHRCSSQTAINKLSSSKVGESFHFLILSHRPGLTTIVYMHLHEHYRL
jgi:hypothetical protein